jgi:hypothetical protein
MTPLELSGTLLGVGLVAGSLGALLGLGGGFIVVPFLTLVLGVNIHLAVGASIVAVVATSSGAAVSYVRDHLANLRVGMFLELATTTGAITGAWLASIVAARVVYLLLGLVLLDSARAVWRNRGIELQERHLPPDPLADRLGLHATYRDTAGRDVSYRVARTKLTLLLMYLAGITSALLGVGAGSMKVPAMDRAMGLPIKASAATSNFMMGVTAATSAGVYFARGEIDPLITAPVAVGVLIGAVGGSRILPKLHDNRVRILFAVVVLGIAATMLAKGVS